MNISVYFAQNHIYDFQSSSHPDPFSVLGSHVLGEKTIIRAYLPNSKSVKIVDMVDKNIVLSEMHESEPGFYEAVMDSPKSYKLLIAWPEFEQLTADPYAFGTQLSDDDLYLFNEGRHFNIADVFGAHEKTINGISGVLFSVWAPNARSASVVGDFNSWDQRRHPMRKRVEAGMFELFIPNVFAGAKYKFAFTNHDGQKLPWKADPLARQSELPPRTASIVAPELSHQWADENWLNGRHEKQREIAPLSIYEVHVEAWLKLDVDHKANWQQAAQRLIPYVKSLGFTHIELMPIAEYPFGGSWGYQPLGLFSPTSRLGTPEDFAGFVDACHAADIGVLLDWVPAHFPIDEHGMGRFDGTALYEHLDAREGFHPDWNTYIYNFGRNEVRSYLISSAVWWLNKFHIDGIRVDAVASMLYRDYSRPSGEWIPNIYGGRENLESVYFLKQLNGAVKNHCPGVIMIAEESTAWPGVTSNLESGGLDFDFKWNLGWMHDTLEFFEQDPIYRRYHMRNITFGLEYGFSEKFILPLSHDEVVHGKGHMLEKMPGDEWQKFANLRTCLAMMFTHPGKKLLFMGIENAPNSQWSVDEPFFWPHEDDHLRMGLRHLVADLNKLYVGKAALHERDHQPDGFEWIIKSDTSNTVFAYRRKGYHDDIVVVANLTPVPRHNYRLGVQGQGFWQELLNTDSSLYGGSNVGNEGGVHTLNEPMHGFAQSIEITLPPLSVVAFQLEKQA